MASDLNLGPAVENGRLRYVSVSAVATASEDQDGGCLRKWWFDKVAGLPKPTFKGQEIGTQVHAEIEHYLRTGEDVLGSIARPGKHFLPEPKHPGLLVEHALGIGAAAQDGRATFTDELTVTLDPRTGQPVTDQLAKHGFFDTVPFVGFIDAVNATGTWVDTEGERHEGGPLEIIDWKTSKNVGRYAKAGSALARTIQMAGYARWAMRTRNVDEVRVSHVTFATEGRKQAVKSTAVLTRLTVDGRWYNVSRTVGEMARAARETDPARVAPTYTACGAFGGCPFRDACPRDAHTALRDLLGATGEKFMGVLDDVMGKAENETSGAPFGGAIPGKDKMPSGMSVADRKAWLKAEQEAQLAELEAEEKAETEKAALAKAYPPKGKEPEKPASPVKGPALKAKDAKQRGEYLIPFGSGLVVGEYIGLTKGGRSFSTADGVLLLADEDGIYSCAPIAPDAPKAGESGPVATPIPPGDVVPANVRAAADKVAPYVPPPEKPAKEKKPKKAKTAETPAEPKKKWVDDALDPQGAAAEAMGGDDEAAATALQAISPEPTADATRAVDPGPAPEEPVDPDESVALTPKGAAEVPSGFTLLVDAVPTTGIRARNLASVVEVVHEAMRETFKCDDVRCANDDRLAFGRWKGAFAAGVRHYHERTPLSGYVVAEARGNELVALAVEALAPLANVVIRGL